MSRKNVLSPQRLTAAQSLSASFNSTATLIPFMDNCAYQINATTSDAVGTFAVQGSVDYVPATANSPGNTGNWVDLSLGGGTPTLASANDSLIINLMQVPFNALRLAYTRTSGTGTAELWVMSKQVGG